MSKRKQPKAQQKNDMDDLILGSVEEDVEEEELDSDQIIGLTNLVAESRAIQDMINQAEAELAQKKERLRAILQIEIPETMDELGVSKIETTTGLKVTVKSDLKASITKENQEAAYSWLERHGFADIIKGDVVVAFDRGQVKEKREFCKTVQKMGLPYNEREQIHWQTLRAFIKEQLDQGSDIPLDLFGVYQFREAVIK